MKFIRAVINDTLHYVQTQNSNRTAVIDEYQELYSARLCRRTKKLFYCFTWKCNASQRNISGV